MQLLAVIVIKFKRGKKRKKQWNNIYFVLNALTLSILSGEFPYLKFNEFLRFIVCQQNSICKYLTK